MKSAKQTKRAGHSPKGAGRYERSGRTGQRGSFRYERTESEWENTGAFTGIGRPDSVGVSPEVAYSTRKLAQRASREMRRWQRTLPKGVKV